MIQVKNPCTLEDGSSIQIFPEIHEPTASHARLDGVGIPPHPSLPWWFPCAVKMDETLYGGAIFDEKDVAVKDALLPVLFSGPVTGGWNDGWDHTRPLARYRGAHKILDVEKKERILLIYDRPQGQTLADFIKKIKDQPDNREKESLRDIFSALLSAIDLFNDPKRQMCRHVTQPCRQCYASPTGKRAFSRAQEHRLFLSRENAPMAEVGCGGIMPEAIVLAKDANKTALRPKLLFYGLRRSASSSPKGAMTPPPPPCKQVCVSR